MFGDRRVSFSSIMSIFVFRTKAWISRYLILISMQVQKRIFMSDILGEYKDGEKGFKCLFENCF